MEIVLTYNKTPGVFKSFRPTFGWEKEVKVYSYKGPFRVGIKSMDLKEIYKYQSRPFKSTILININLVSLSLREINFDTG